MKLGLAPDVRLAVGRDGIRVFGTGEDADFRWPESGEGFGEQLVKELQASLGDVGRARVSLVLLPPLVDVRTVRLPRLRSHETTALLENHASRYFPDRIKDAATGWTPVRNDGDERLVLAAATEQEPLALLIEALQHEGHAVGDPVPAHLAWVAAAEPETSFRAKPGGSLCVELGSGCTILRFRHGALLSCAAFLRDTLPTVVERLRGELRDGRCVAVIGDGATADGIADELRVGTPRQPVRLTEDPVRLAARFARASRGPVVLPRHLRERRMKTRRMAEIARFVVAGFLLVGAAGLHTVGMSRDLADVRTERAGHAAEVDRLLAIQDRVSTVDAWFTDASKHVRAGRRWSEWLTQIIGALPAGTRLEQIVGRTGELEIVGTTGRSSDVLTALQALPGVIAVDLPRPVRRVEGPAGTAQDQFSFVVRIDVASVP